jgi:plasmid stabilization system protein ParE
MKYIVFSPAAFSEADEARAWYENREPGLGLEFIQAVDECLARILRNPSLFRSIGGPYQRALMQRFPYVVVFEDRPDCIWLLAVFHAARNPKILQQRLKRQI